MAEKTGKPMILDLHIPYCVRPERFQNRYFAVGSNEEKNAYLAALKREVLSYKGDLDEYEIRAVTLSGGSATVMSPDRLGDLLRTVREELPVSKGVEISVDAHPLTICTPALTGIASGHPNRMELIMQSKASGRIFIHPEVQLLPESLLLSQQPASSICSVRKDFNRRSVRSVSITALLF